jgi:CelD/BcsL family acetyltransferase involved in cellulose biosynthesis
MQLDVLSPRELTPEHLDAFARLRRAGALTSPFLTPAWLQALETAGGPDAGRLKVVALHEGGAVRGFFAARVRRGVAGPPGAPLCDTQGVVAEGPLDLAPGDLAAALGAARLDFDKLRPGQPAFGPYVRGEAPGFLIDLAGGFDAYAAERRAAGAGILQDIAKKRRKCEREAGPLRFSPDDPEALGALLSWKSAQYRATGQPDIFRIPWPKALLQTLLASEDPSCRARLFSLRRGEELIAAHLALEGEGVLHAWFIAHASAFAAYSPGLVLLAEVLRWAAGEGIFEVDLGAGDYRFKRSLSNLTRTLAHGFVGRPSGASLVRAAAYRVRATAEALPLGPASTLPGKAMRRLDLVRSLR